VSHLSDRIRGILGNPAPGNPAIRQSGNSAISPARPRDLSALGGAWQGDSFVVERRFEASARHGTETIGAIADRTAGASAQAAWFSGGSPARTPFVFFDLETTGLSGGAGTHAFLVGCAWFEARALIVRQFVLTSVGDEKAMLDAVREPIGNAGALVSFNGKSFDAPLLESRYLFHRLEWAAARVPHVDVLHPARRFWGGGHHPAAVSGECSLAALERHIVGARRTGDVPGFEIPSRYFQFLRTGNAGHLAGVLEHNRLDLITLAALTSRLLHLARAGPAEARTARESLALGHVLARAGLDAQAREAFERSIALTAAPEGAFDATRIDALRALALAWRHARQFARAADVWTRLLQIRGCPAPIAREASEALAVHHEHRLRDLAAARGFALRGLEVEEKPSKPEAAWTRAVQHRLARIERKMSVSAQPTLLSLSFPS